MKETQRHKLGKLLGTRTRNFLLMSATPHNGKEADFQLFMGLLDADRFEGRFREGVHKADVSDMMRRLTKEELYRFDGTPLFPERCAYTASYSLSQAEADLYQAVTTYVREEMNRADRTGDDKRRMNVGFALQILQRRLASSPAAIHRSLERRRKRLEERLREERLMRRGGPAPLARSPELPTYDPDDIDEVPGAEAEVVEEEILDQATAAQTLAEPEAEIAILTDLEARALRPKLSGQDAKWRQPAGFAASAAGIPSQSRVATAELATSASISRSAINQKWVPSSTPPPPCDRKYARVRIRSSKLASMSSLQSEPTRSNHDAMHRVKCASIPNWQR